MRLLPRLTVAGLLACAPAAAEEPPWPGLAGSGLLTLPDTRTLPRGRVQAGLSIDNRDRDPLGLDLLDLSLSATVGAGRRLELFGRAVVSRVVSLPELPALPPPPLDLVVGPGAVAPPRPHYALYAPTPYVNKRGTARLDDWVPGDALVGAKARLLDGRGARPALALAGEVTLPLSRADGDLLSGSGTGGVDGGLRLVAQWGADPSLVATVRYTRVGAPARGDRELRIAPDGGAEVQDHALDLPDRLEVGLGARRRLRPSLAAVVETVAIFEVGPRTPVVDAAWPLDVLGGLQARRGRLGLVAGLRYHGHALPSGDRRHSPVAGMIDLTGVEDAALVSYLEEVGAGGAAPYLRAHTQRLLALAAPGAPLPPGARVVPQEYTIRSEHQVGFVLMVAWLF